MAEVHVFGRVTNDLQLKMSHRQVPYVSFGLVEWIGRRDTGHRQYFEVWAWGTAALSLADAEIHKDSRIWVQGFLELVDCTRNGGSEKDKRLKLSLTGWQAKPPHTAQTRTKAKPRRCPAAAASCGGRGRRSGTPAGISVFRQSEKEEPRDVF